MSPLERLQSDIAARLESDPFFADIGIYLFRPRANLAATEIQGRIDQSLNCLVKKGGKGGAAVTVLMPLADVPSANAPGPQLEIKVTVRVQEIPLLNMGAEGTQKSAEEIAIAVLQALHLFIPHGTSQNISADKDALTPNLEFSPKLTYDANFRTFIALPQLQKVVTPLITGTPDAVTLASSTAGASIYYTTDGSYPTSADNLYSAPFAAASGAEVRAVAVKTGMQASDVNSKKI